MTILAIILIILAGILLILLEFFVIPGATIAGIGGFVAISVGVYMAYSNFGVAAGNYAILGASLSFVLVLILAFKSGTWKKLSLKAEINSKVNENVTINIQPGDTGTTVSRLAPMGKVVINDNYYEAKSESGLIDAKQTIVVYKIKHTQIIVKKQNQTEE